MATVPVSCAVLGQPSPVRLLDLFRLGSLTLTTSLFSAQHPPPPKTPGPLGWPAVSLQALGTACPPGGRASPCLVTGGPRLLEGCSACCCWMLCQCANPSMEGTVTVAEKKSLVAHGTALIPLWLLDTFLLGDGLSPPRDADWFLTFQYFHTLRLHPVEPVFMCGGTQGLDFLFHGQTRQHLPLAVPAVPSLPAWP